MKKTQWRRVSTQSSILNFITLATWWRLWLKLLNVMEKLYIYRKICYSTFESLKCVQYTHNLNSRRCWIENRDIAEKFVQLFNQVFNFNTTHILAHSRSQFEYFSEGIKQLTHEIRNKRINSINFISHDKLQCLLHIYWWYFVLSIWTWSFAGTKIVYERTFLMNLKNSPLSRTPPKNIPCHLMKDDKTNFHQHNHQNLKNGSYQPPKNNHHHHKKNEDKSNGWNSVRRPSEDHQFDMDM